MVCGATQRWALGERTGTVVGVATVVGQVVVVLDVLVGAPLAGEDALDPDTEHEPPLIHHDVHARARHRER
jgi:hypothetical protein